MRRAIRGSLVRLGLPVMTRLFRVLLARKGLPVPILRCRVRRAQLVLLALRVSRDRRVRGVFAARRALLGRRAMLAQPALKGLLARRVIRGLRVALVRRASLGLAVRQVSLGLLVRKAPKAFRASRVRRAPLVCRWTFRARSQRMRICRKPLPRVTPMWLPRTGNSTFTTARHGLLMAAVCHSRVRLGRRAFRGRRD